MRFTSRLPDWCVASALAGVPVAALWLLSSCASDRTVGSEVGDAEIDSDAGRVEVEDARSETNAPQDTPRSDAGPLPITCASPPCVTSLTTTVAPYNIGEGFCALLQDGTVACWGQNQGGQLGRGDAQGIRDSAVPARIAGLVDVVAIAHSCAIDKSGSTWCWGTGPYLQDENVVTTTQTTPVKVPIPSASLIDFALVEDSATGCAKIETGVVCWGGNRNGQLGAPEFGVDPSLPVPSKPIAVAEGAPLQSLSMGNASFVLRTDGTLLSWGANPPLGRVSSLFPDPHPKSLALTGVSNVDTGGDNACAVAQGIAYCWGTSQASANKLGRALPEPLPIPEAVVQVSTAATAQSATPHRGCAIGLSGAVYCWGNNEIGQVGDGTKTFAFSPVKVSGLPGLAARVKTHPTSACAVLTSGKVYCWGDNAYGQLGSAPMKEPSLVPKEVALP